MTVMTVSSTGAPSTKAKWNTINWCSAETEVYRLQMRIAKARREGCHGKVKSLQWLLTHSYYAKILAVKRVTQNRGSRTPGVDKVIWQTSNQKMQAAQSLKRRGYQTQPLRRIYIPKKNGRLRPLGIPTMKCRAMQALHVLALEPIAEEIANKNSYGFRPKRNAADAIEQCFIMLARKGSAKWILEADIKSCFDRISHQWLRENIPMDKEMLNKWLDAGYIEQQRFHQTTEGTPQGGIISPTLLNITLSDLEKQVSALINPRKDKVHFSIYADDFVITGATKEVLEQVVRPTVENFLKTRGLELSQEKTKITHIDDGFDFLGANIRKYNDKLVMMPSNKSIKCFLEDIRSVIKSNRTAKTESLIRLLNPKIRGWTQYFRHICAKTTFAYIDFCIFNVMLKWMKRRHPMKSAAWLKKKYFRQEGLRNWIISAKIYDNKRAPKNLDLFQAAYVSIKRHRKVRADANLYNPTWQDYFEERGLLQLKANR